MKKLITVALKVPLLVVAFSIAMTAGTVSAQPPQPGPTAVPERVFEWYPKELPLKDRRIYVEVEILNEKSVPDAYDRLIGKTYPYGERFGNRIGNLIPVRFRIFLLKPKEGQREIEVQLAPLLASPPRLTINAVQNPDWHIAKTDALKPGEAPLSIDEVKDVVLEWGGQRYECSRMIQVTALVQTFKDPRYRINLWLEFTYALSLLPDGGVDWRPLETPDFWVDLSPVADPGPALSLGNTDKVAPLRPTVPALLLIGMGSLFVFLPLAHYASRALRRKWASDKALDPAELFTREVETIFAACKVELDGGGVGYRFTAEQAGRIVTAIGAYVLATDGVNIDAWTIEELKEKEDEITDGEAWYLVLKPLKRGIVQLGKKLSPRAGARLVAQIREICPQR